MSVTAGLVIADQVLGFFGMSGPDFMARILNRGGDKRRRLDQIEMLGNATAMHVANTLRSTESLFDPNVEPTTEDELRQALRNAKSALVVKDGLLLTAMQTLAQVVKAADLDGSSAG